jgi:lysophospholipase L1-like esterase
MLTLGTSWIYKLASTGRVVANCHKIPAREFNREFLEPSETAAVLAPVLRKLLTINPSVQFVFTVSPIRHWKDGAIENTRSKAALHLAIRQLQSQFSNAYYFPSYEIFMDELRDYRYYAADMLHPSEFAVNYLWDRVKNNLFRYPNPSILFKGRKTGKIV